jgi:hypothetical protein
MNYYAFANRLRGSESKLVGCGLLIAPSVLAFCFAWLASGKLSPWSFLGLGAYLLHVLIIFKWFWGSDYWASMGKAGDAKKLTALWKWKSIIGFALLFYPFGYKMQRVGAVYIAAKDDIEGAEYETGRIYTPHILGATVTSLFYIAAPYLWGLT